MGVFPFVAAVEQELKPEVGSLNEDTEGEEKATGSSSVLSSAVANQISWWSSVRASAAFPLQTLLLCQEIYEEWGEATRGRRGWDGEETKEEVGGKKERSCR